MDLSNFLKNFETTADAGNGAMDPAVLNVINADFTECIAQLGGKTFSNGLYRVVRGDRIRQATAAIEEAFPEYRGKIVAFGYDWLGRHFVLDYRRVENNEPHILMLEIGAGEAMQIPVGIGEFHQREIVEYADAALAREFFTQWRKLNPTDIVYQQCVGYKVPLFLGGRDTLDNLELSELQVYVSICAQLRSKTKNLPPGTKIGDIRIS